VVRFGRYPERTGRNGAGDQETPMPTRWIATMAAIPVLLTAACAPATSAAPPSPPAEARPLEAGAHDQRLDDVTQELRDALEARHGRLKIEAYRLPADASWSSMAAHYQGALSGWSPEPALPARIRAAHARAWTHGGDLLAVALIDTPVAGQHSDYTVLVVANR
jgi:hypothetical protein